MWPETGAGGAAAQGRVLSAGRCFSQPEWTGNSRDLRAHTQAPRSKMWTEEEGEMEEEEVGTPENVAGSRRRSLEAS